MNETVIVIKDTKTRQIHTFVNLEGFGARVSIPDFISLVAEYYGSPATTMTRKGFLAGLQAAAEKAVYHMKGETKAVAAVNLEPEVKSQYDN